MRLAELSLCMIVKNEEERLGNCLASVRRVVDEIVVADTGSTDGTKAVARRYADTVLDVPWEDDFSSARNASLAAGTKPYLLWLDADDVLDPDAARRLSALRGRLDGTVDAVFLPYLYAFHADGTPALVFERERIVRKDAGFRFEGRVHEAMAVSGNVLHEDIPVRHTRTHAHGRRNLSIYERAIAAGAKLSPRDVYYYARELRDCGETARAERAFADFLAMDGWRENALDAHVQRGACLEALGRAGEARGEYLAALGTEPRAEALCALGALCMREGRAKEAEFWYRAALLTEPPLGTGAFVDPDAYGYAPLLQLCVLLDAQGRTDEAREMNERALALRPGDETALRNRAYFEAAAR